MLTNTERGLLRRYEQACYALKFRRAHEDMTELAYIAEARQLFLRYEYARFFAQNTFENGRLAL